jgi:hypothetical protein
MVNRKLLCIVSFLIILSGCHIQHDPCKGNQVVTAKDYEECSKSVGCAMSASSYTWMMDIKRTYPKCFQ